MILKVALAFSGCNKASALDDRGAKIVVQQRYSATALWYHVWRISRQTVLEKEWNTLEEIDSNYLVSSQEDYWSAQ